MKLLTRRRLNAAAAFALAFIMMTAAGSLAFSGDPATDEAYPPGSVRECTDPECRHQAYENVTHYIQEPVVYIYEEPILVSATVTYQNPLFAEVEESERSIWCLNCDGGPLSWRFQSYGQPYRGPEHQCCHGYPRGSDDPWYRNDQWAYACGRCNWLAQTEYRTVTLAESCHGRN